MAEQGKLDPFVLVVEGSIPNEKIKKEGYWAALGTDPNTGQPITTNEWIDRLAPKALAVIGMRNMRHLRRHSRHGRQPDRLPWDWTTISVGIGAPRLVSQSSTFPDVRCSRTTSWRRCSTCCIRWPDWRP